MSTIECRPAGLLLDIGGTVLRATSFDFEAGIRALNPLVAGNSLITELRSAIDAVHRSNSADFAMTQWITKNRKHFSREGSLADLEHLVYRETFSPILIPGIRKVLIDLKRLNVSVGCVSNTVFSSRVLLREMRRHRLTNLIRFVVSSAEYSIRKPKREIFLAGVNKLGLKPSQTWFVGDTWEIDIEGAAAAALFPVYLSSTEQSPRSGVRHARAATWPQVWELVMQAPA